jgi:protein involved in polysaccharide export with SLBB domain
MAIRAILLRHVLFIMALLSALSCIPGFGLISPALAEAGLQQDDLDSSGADAYRLDTGDKVRVIVFGEDDLGGQFQIDDKGFIRLPLIGQLKAAGSSPKELEGDIAAALGNGYLNNPRVSVEVTDYRPFYILGEVNKPGQYAYVNDMSALNAVALGGGYTVKASDSWVYVRRDGQNKEVRLAADATTKIHPGDVVRIPPTAFWAAITIAGPLSAIISTRWYLPQPPQ